MRIEFYIKKISENQYQISDIEKSKFINIDKKINIDKRKEKIEDREYFFISMNDIIEKSISFKFSKISDMNINEERLLSYQRNERFSEKSSLSNQKKNSFNLYDENNFNLDDLSDKDKKLFSKILNSMKMKKENQEKIDLIKKMISSYLNDIDEKLKDLKNLDENEYLSEKDKIHNDLIEEI